MDRRRRQWVPLAVNVAHGDMAARLCDEFGRDGLLVWVLYLAACKANPAQGEFSYTSDVDGWTKLGLYGHEPDFTLDEFFSVTGRLKKTRRTRVGHVTNVVNTRWGHWNYAAERDVRAARSARKRQENTGTLEARYRHERGTKEALRSTAADQDLRPKDLELQSQDLDPRARARDAATVEDREEPEPAAAAPIGEAELRTLVAAFPGSDSRTLDVVEPLARSIPHQTMHELVETVHDRKPRNPVGLLVRLLEIARREHQQTLVAREVNDRHPEAVERLTVEQALEQNIRTLAANGHPWHVVRDFINPDDDEAEAWAHAIYESDAPA